MKSTKERKIEQYIKSICNGIEKKETTKERIRVLEQKRTIIKKGRGFFLARVFLMPHLGPNL